jgi:hypothetical protein
MSVVFKANTAGVSMADNLESQCPISAAPSLRGGGEPIGAALEYVRKSLAGLQFGVVSITVHDGFIIQVDRTERMRFRKDDHRDP